MKRLALSFTVVALALAAGSASASAQSDPYHITAYEKAACATDAARFCADTYPNEKELLGCMKTNRSSLGRVCKMAFNAGLKSRHIQ